MKIKIRYRTDFEKIIYAIFLVIFLEGSLSIFVPQLHPLYYFVDVFNIILLVEIIVHKSLSMLFNTSMKWFMIIFSASFICTILGIIVNFSSISLHLWGIRNFYSNLIFFIACVAFEHSDSLEFLNKLFGINLGISIIEILLGYRQDWIGGVYGVSGGQVNGPLNILLIVLMIKIILEYINKTINLRKVFVWGIASLLVATFAELKIFYIEICVIIVLCSLVTKFSYKKLILIALGLVGILAGIKILFIIFPEIDSRMFSPTYIWNYLTNPGGYVGQFAHDAGDINRLSFWNKCINLLNNNFNRIFGMGIGNCDQVEVLGIQSDFYRQYSTLHYYMFPLPMILLQQGILGMVLYVLLFVFLFYAIAKQKKKSNDANIVKYQMAEVLCLMAFIITIYDTSLFGKGGFLFFYILALPFININRK